MVLVSTMALLLLVAGCIIVFSREHVQADPFVVATLLVNIAIFFTQFLLAVWKYPFSFDMIFWLFNLFFLGFAPLLQHLTNVYVWNLQPTIDEVRRNNLLIFLWAGCYIAGKNVFRVVKIKQMAQKAARKVSAAVEMLVAMVISAWEGSRAEALAMKIRDALHGIIKKLAADIKAGCEHVIHWMQGHKMGTFVEKASPYICKIQEYKKNRNARTKAMDRLLLVSVLILLIELLSGGMNSLFIRSGGGLQTSSVALNLIIGHGFTNILLFTAVLYGIRLKRIKKVDFKVVLAFICLVLCCFPTAISRSSAATIYAGLMIILFDQTRVSRWFAFVIVGGLILVFPALEVFRSASRLQEHGFWNLLAQCFANNYLGGHYDAYQMFISVQRYVSEFGLTWGKQVLGALLFFVPRSIWPNKPIGTGHMVIIELNQNEFTNVSAPLVAEGYINFGVVGVVLFAVVLGAFVEIIDREYWKNEDRLSLIRILYPFAMFQFFFFLRGDMMSAWAYTFALLAVAVAIYQLVVYRTGGKFPCKRKNNKLADENNNLSHGKDAD